MGCERRDRGVRVRELERRLRILVGV